MLQLTLDHFKVKQLANKNYYHHQGFMLRYTLCGQKKKKADLIIFLKWCQVRVHFSLALAPAAQLKQARTQGRQTQHWHWLSWLHIRRIRFPIKALLFPVTERADDLETVAKIDRVKAVKKFNLKGPQRLVKMCFPLSSFLEWTFCQAPDNLIWINFLSFHGLENSSFLILSRDAPVLAQLFCIDISLDEELL